jgi:hypothetical protein
LSATLKVLHLKDVRTAPRVSASVTEMTLGDIACSVELAAGAAG